MPRSEVRILAVRAQVVKMTAEASQNARLQDVAMLVDCGAASKGHRLPDVFVARCRNVVRVLSQTMELRLRVRAMLFEVIAARVWRAPIARGLRNRSYEASERLVDVLHNTVYDRVRPLEWLRVRFRAHCKRTRKQVADHGGWEHAARSTRSTHVHRHHGLARTLQHDDAFAPTAFEGGRQAERSAAHRKEGVSTEVMVRMWRASEEAGTSRALLTLPHNVVQHAAKHLV
mmetsp:Transcript_29564/g.80892  ORF Transcript_29564/g.80892 Transcript_29564/m.80892 type:complete len:230 (-) Transcript_29564:310-999(-)